MSTGPQSQLPTGARSQLPVGSWTRLPADTRPGARGNGPRKLRRWAIAAAVVVLVVVAAGLVIVLRGNSPASSTPQATSPQATNPQATKEYQTPRGADQLAWSQAILTKLGDPLTAANIVSMGYWMQNEAGTAPTGIVGANNPINVSQPGYGGTPIQSEGGGYSLYSYPTPADGIDATVTYLNRPSYGGIRAALKAGVGLSSSSLGSEFSTYSGGGYSTVPDSWGASQGKPQS